MPEIYPYGRDAPEGTYFAERRGGFDRGEGGPGEEWDPGSANNAASAQAAMELARMWATAPFGVEPDPTNYPGYFSSFHYATVVQNILDNSADTQILFNDGGDIVGNAAFTYQKLTGVLKATGGLVASRDGDTWLAKRETSAGATIGGVYATDTTVGLQAWDSANPIAIKAEYVAHADGTAYVTFLDKFELRKNGGTVVLDVDQDGKVVLTPQTANQVVMEIATGQLKLYTPTSTHIAPLRIPHGTTPAVLSDGDIWTTTSGVFARVNGATVDLTSTGGAGTWGSITGTLSSQTDLQAALDAKANTSALSAYLPLAGGTMTGSITMTSGYDITWSGSIARLAATPSGLNSQLLFKPPAPGTSFLVLEPTTVGGSFAGGSGIFMFDYDATLGPFGSGDTGYMALQTQPGVALHHLSSQKVGSGFYSRFLPFQIGADLTGGNGPLNIAAHFGWDSATGTDPYVAIGAVTRLAGVKLQVNGDANVTGTLKLSGTALSEYIDDRVSNLLVAGSGITLTYNDAGDALTVAASGGGGGGAPKVVQVACSDLTTSITAGTSKAVFRMPYAMTVTAVRASLATAQTSGAIFTVDINEGGTSILSTKLTIDNTEKTSTTAATAAVVSDTSLADDAEITVDVDQVGDGTAKGLIVTIIGT